MANLDSAGKRAAGLALTLAYVLPVPDGSDADSILQRAHLVSIYGSVIEATVPLDINGKVRIVLGHRYRMLMGHRYRLIQPQ